MSDNPQPLIPSFDLDALRLPQNFGEALSVKRPALELKRPASLRALVLLVLLTGIELVTY